MTELEKALSGEQFNRRDAEVIAFQNRVKDMCFEFNHTLPSSANDVVFMWKTMISEKKREPRLYSRDSSEKQPNFHYCP